jgi:hypothetical protein
VCSNAAWRFGNDGNRGVGGGGGGSGDGGGGDDVARLGRLEKETRVVDKLKRWEKYSADLA